MNVVRRLLRPRRLAGLAVLTSLAGIVLFFGSIGIDSDRVVSRFEIVTTTLLMIVALPITALVLSSAAFGEERKSHTMPFLVLKPTPRWIIALAVTLAAVVATIVTGGVGVLITWLVGAVFSGQGDIGLGTAAALLVAAMGYAAFFVPLGLMVSRSTIAGLAYIFIWESIIGAFVTGVAASSMYRTALSASAALTTMTPDGLEAVEDILGPVAVGAGGAFAKVTVLLILSVAVTTLWLRYVDLAQE